MPKTLLAEFTVKAGHEERVREMMQVLAKRVREEPGNVLFEPYVKAGNPRTYVVYEVYRDDAAFREHLEAPHGAVFNGELGEHIEGEGSELTFLESFIGE